MQPTGQAPLPEYQIESSQSPEVLRKVFADQGFDVSVEEDGSTAVSGKPEESEGDKGKKASAEEGKEKVDATPTLKSEKAEDKPAEEKLSRRARAREADAKEKADLKTKNDELLARIERLEKGEKSPAEDVKVKADETAELKAPEKKPKPKLEDFADADDPYAALAEGIADWKYDERKAMDKYESDKAEQAKRKETDAAAAATSEVEQWVDKAREEYPDWDDRLEAPATAREFNKSHALIAALRDSENGQKLAYFLADPANAEDLKKIVAATQSKPGKVTPAEFGKLMTIANRHLGRIEDKLEASSSGDEDAEVDDEEDDAVETPESKPVAAQPKPAAAEKKAKPAPPDLVSERGATRVKKPLASMSADELRSMDPDEFRKQAGA